jgi:hypothetical protein
MLSFLTVVSLSLALLAYSFGGVDFGVYYAAGRVLLHGGNPYNYSQLIAEIVSSTGATNNPYYYAPWFTWAMSLFALFPYQIARILWAILNFGFWFWGLFNLSRLIAWPVPGWRRWGMYLFATFVFAWATWGSEQVGVLIFLILTFVMLSFENGKWIPMGVWMALMLFKPNITAVPIMALACWLIIRKEWRPIVSMTVTLLFMTAISLLVSPGWYLDLAQPDKVTGLSYTLSESGALEIKRYTTTLLDWLSIYGVSGNLAYGIYAVFAFAGLLFLGHAVYGSRSIIQLMSTAVLINFALIPYALFYDYPSLSLALFYINAGLSGNPKLIWAQRITNSLILASLFVGNNIAYRYSIVIILLLTTVFSRMFMIQKQRTI